MVTVVRGEIVRRHGFPCRASGANYLAEMVALLAALQAVPSNAPLIVHTDCLSGIFSANKRRCRDWKRGVFLRSYALPQRRRILCAARPILNGIRAMLAGRAAPTMIEHVRSHTGALDEHSRMNEVADVEANRARCAAWGETLPLDIWGEERHTLHLGHVPVIGAFKPAILRSMSERAIRRWCKPKPGSSLRTPDLPPLKPEAAHSARLFSAHRHALQALSYTVAKNRDPWLSRFWMLAVAEWLPVERRMLKCCRPGAAFRGHSCKLCNAEVETVRHVFVCPHPGLVDSRADSVGGTLSVLHAAGIRSRTGMTSCPGLTQRVRCEDREYVVQWVRAWFDLSGRSWLEICTPADEYPLDSEMLRMDPLAAVLGVMPDAVVNLLRGKRLPMGAWGRRTLREVSDLQGRLQLTLLRGALEVWKERCRAVDRWWLSPAAQSAVRARSEVMREVVTRKLKPRGSSSYTARMKRKAQKRRQSSPESVETHGRASQPTSVLLPGEPDPVDRPGDWMVWRAEVFVADGAGSVSMAQGLSRADSVYMARVAAVSGGTPRNRRQTDFGPHMVQQDAVCERYPYEHRRGLPWF